MAKKLRILNLEPEDYSPKALALLKTLGQVDNGPWDSNDLLNRIKDYDILIVRLGYHIDAGIMDVSLRLKTIVSATTGLNHIDMVYAKKKGIAVLSLKGEREFLDNVHATAEHTLALLLALVRHLVPAHNHAIKSKWNRNIFKGMELYGKTLGIIGLGRIGSRVAHYGFEFGMNVIATDINPVASVNRVKKVTIEELLSNSDIISLHVNYTAENEKMIDSSTFSTMKKGAFFVNTSRGELVDEKALLTALQGGKLAGAALDVLTDENTGGLEHNSLLVYAREHDNLIVTPHIGGATFESMEKTEIFMAKKLLKHYKKKEKKYGYL